MALESKDRQEVILYLLGRLKTEGRSQQIEERILIEQDFYEELLVIEDEVIDQYLSNELSPDEREAFEQYFLKTPERTRKLRFARAFSKYVAAASDVPATPAPAVVPYRRWEIFRSLFASPIRVAAVSLAAIFFSLLAWWMFAPSNSEVGRGLVALREAYSNRRPLEARITGFEYAPWSITRGGASPPEVDAIALDRAAVLLLNAVREHPGSASKHALGQFYLAARKYDQAIALFEDALKTDKDNAELHNDLGVALFEKGRMERPDESSEKDIESLARSVEQFKKAVELDSSRAEAYFNRALAFQQMMLREQAEESWREYLRRDSTSPWADEARRNLKLLEENRNATSQNSDNALKEFLEARRAGDDNAAWKVISHNYTSAGNEVTNRLLDSHLGLSPPDSSIEPGLTLQAMSYLAQLELNNADNRYTSDLVREYEHASPELQQALKDARSHMKNGYALFTKSLFAQAVGEYKKAKLDYERAGDTAEIAFAEYRLAHCYVFLPDLKKAHAAFERLSAICRTNKYGWLLAHCLYGLAHVSVDSNEYTKAVDYSSRALAAFEQVKDINGVLRCLVQLADVHQHLNRIGRSLSYLRRGLMMTDDNPAEPTQRWGILVEIAFSLSSMRLHTAALFYQKEALMLALEIGRPLHISRSYGYVGSAYAAVKKYDEALKNVAREYEVGEAVPEDPGRSEILADASQQSGDILRQAGECGKAVQAYDKGIQLYDALSIEYQTYPAHKGKLLCYIAGSDDQATGAELRTVLDLFERYRAKITAESHRNSFFGMEQSVYDLAIGYEFNRMKNPVRAFEYSEVSRARSLLDELSRGAQVLEKGDGPDIKLSGVTTPLTLSDIQKGIPEDTQILQYAVLDDRLLIWVVTRSGIHPEVVDMGAQQLTEKVRAYLAAVSQPPAADSVDPSRLAADLYQVLIAPAEPFLDKRKSLYIVPDKILHYLPYNALVSPATARYLMEDYDLGLAPSSSIFVAVTASTSKKAGAFEESLLSVGDPSFNRALFPTLSYLPLAAREANAVSGFYKARRVLLREQANELSITSEMEKAGVAHLAMHYVVDESSEMLSGFPLAPESAPVTGRKNLDGFLQSYEIYKMKLPRTRLVVLSACQTSIEQQYDGEGAVGVARPFLVAGVPNVVASLWSVDTDSSGQLMVNFHRHRTGEALTIPRALKQAQIEMARGSDERYRHPYYWAPFVAIGGHSQF
ncbi:MAG TPA: CHAT domain-containing protein [Pyrinomonadaceae bacterium]|nr:CHAT domain-containing protein [Pyrinomonadaceae bacterium]